MIISEIAGLVSVSLLSDSPACSYADARLEGNGIFLLCATSFPAIIRTVGKNAVFFALPCILVLRRIVDDSFSIDFP